MLSRPALKDRITTSKTVQRDVAVKRNSVAPRVQLVGDIRAEQSKPKPGLY